MKREQTKAESNRRTNNFVAILVCVREKDTTTWCQKYKAFYTHKLLLYNSSFVYFEIVWEKRINKYWIISLRERELNKGTVVK